MESNEILKHILPKEFSEYFEITGIKEQDNKLLINLDERNILPEEHSDKPLESKGFYEPVNLQDFPIRYKAVMLVIRKRKWRDKITGETYSRNWELTAKGTSFTKEFAAFLKELVR